MRSPLTLGPDRYAFFNVTFTPQGPVIVPEEAEASRKSLVAFLERAAREHGVRPARVVAMGFSQGAIMAMGAALTAPRGLPVFVSHGVHDTKLPVHHGRASRALLEGLPVALTYREYGMGHEIGEESLREIGAWLSAHLDRPEEAHGAGAA